MGLVSHFESQYSVPRCVYFPCILHVCWAVFWLVHAVSSQQVSEEGFVTNGGVGMTTWGGGKGEYVRVVIIGKGVVSMHTLVLTQGGYFPQNNTKRPPEQETSNNYFMWRKTHINL